MPRRRGALFMRSGGGLARSGESAPHRFEELRHTRAADTRHAQEWEIELRRASSQRGNGILMLRVERVDLVRDDDLRLGGERRLEQFQLLAHSVQVLDRIAPACA